MSYIEDTIIACATPPGKGGVAIVRLSGKHALTYSEHITQLILKPRYAHHCKFKNEQNEIIDEGLTFYFKAPASFTGEDVVEFHCHGSPITVQNIIKACIALGARLAEPGEFSKRAFLNDKMDLTQAEAISDLINASSDQAARSAMRSLQGEFSKAIDELNTKIVRLRMFVESSIDFPDEDIEFIQQEKIVEKTIQVKEELEKLMHTAKQGCILQQGLSVVIAGKPNTGKSSLLNLLCKRDVAIVTDIAGTTRDTLKEYIAIDGIPLHIIDTAGLQKSHDIVEQEGIKRAEKEFEEADAILLVCDASQDFIIPNEIKQYKEKIIAIRNKIDLTNEAANQSIVENIQTISVSIKNNIGIELLENKLKDISGFEENHDQFSARERHITALLETITYLDNALEQIKHEQCELFAEECRLAHITLSQITGKFSSDDLLGEIFSSFCVGK